MIREATRFKNIRGTEMEDYAVERDKCGELADKYPVLARANAYNYYFFAKDGLGSKRW